MAYQSKKHRKFVATTVTAALVATAVAPAAGFAAEKSFTDQIPTWAQDAVSYLVEKGAIEGYPNGTFGSADPLTRAQAAKVLALALELDVDLSASADFADVPAGNWASPYIAAIQDLGIIQGDEKGNFNPNAKIDRQSFAKMVVEAYGLELDENADVSFSDNNSWGAEYIEVLASLGVIQGVGGDKVAPRADVSRGEAAVFVHRTEVEDVRKEVPTKTPVVVEATKVEAVSADNLKEIVVEFDGTVDKETAEDKANYSLKSGKTIKTVELAEDAKTVVLTLENGVTLNNNRTEAVSVSNVKAGEKTVSVSNFEFKVFDNEIPEVTGVTSLGTKAVKVVFSEPVTNVKQSNFTLDGKAFYGKVNVVGNEVVLTPYSSTALAVGDHTLQIAKVEDFAGFTSLTSTNDFTVVEDKDAPTVAEATATLETLTITFSEDVDTETLSASKVYWKSGDAKKAAYDFDQLAGNKVKYFFKEDNTLPTGSVAVHVEGVKDYSGNEIAKDTKVVVTPEIDQTRPEVKKVEVADAKNLKVTFSKALESVSATNTNNYSVLNKDGKVISVKEVTLSSDGKSVNVELYSNLSTGKNTLTVKNVKDKTKLQNTMLDFSQEVNVADSAAPKIDSKVWNNTNRTVVVKFNEKMDIETLTDYSNYHVKVNSNYRALTSSIADIEVLQDGTAVAITFVEKIGNVSVTFGSGSVEELQLLALKDTTGNLLSEFTANVGNKIDFTLGASFGLGQYDKIGSTIYNAALVDRKTIEIKFDFPVEAYLNGAFTVATGSNQIDSIEVNGTSTVKLKFKENIAADAKGISLAVDYTKLVTLAGSGATGGATIAWNQASNTGTLLDEVAPTVKNNEKYAVDSATKTITVEFTEDVQFESAGVDSKLAANDFKVTRVSDNKVLTAGVDYTAAPDSTNAYKVNIVLTDSDETVDGSLYRVEVLSTAKYLVDFSAAKNAIAATSTRETASKIDQVAPTIASVAIVQNDTGNTTVDSGDQLVITFTENVKLATGALSADILADFVVAGGSSALTDATATFTNGKVVITAGTGTVITPDTTTINVATGADAILDIIGNALEALATPITIK